MRMRCCESLPICCVYADCSRVSGSTLGSSEAAKLCSTLPASLNTRVLNDEYSGVSLFALTATVSGSTDDGAATHALSATGNSSCKRTRDDVMPVSAVLFVRAVYARDNRTPIIRALSEIGRRRRRESG